MQSRFLLLSVAIGIIPCHETRTPPRDSSSAMGTSIIFMNAHSLANLCLFMVDCLKPHRIWNTMSSPYQTLTHHHAIATWIQLCYPAREELGHNLLLFLMQLQHEDQDAWESVLQASISLISTILWARSPRRRRFPRESPGLPHPSHLFRLTCVEP